MRKKLIETGFRTFKKLNEPYYQDTAAILGFYFLFSIIPIMTLLFQLLQYFDITINLFTSILKYFEANKTMTSLLNAVEESLGSKANLAFIVLALWSASKIEFSMIRIANYSYGQTDPRPTGYFKSRIRAIFTVSALLMIIMVGLLILVYGGIILDLINYLFGMFLHTQLHAEWLFSMLRWPIAGLLYFFVIAVNYSILPNRHLPVRRTIPGSLFAAIGIIIMTFVYFVVFQRFSNYNLIYGSLAAIIFLLLWFYLLGYILILGMIINVVWYQDDPD